MHTVLKAFNLTKLIQNDYCDADINESYPNAVFITEGC